MQKVCVSHHSYDATLDKCPFCSENNRVNISQNDNMSDDTMKSCVKGHLYPAILEECPYCKKEMEEDAYLTHLCPGCMTYLDQPDLPCPCCGWHIEKKPDGCQPSKLGTILDKKYVIGKIISKKENCKPFTFEKTSNLYIGWDINNKRKVAIREFFPCFFVSCDYDGRIIPREHEDHSSDVDEPTYPLSIEQARQIYAKGKKLFIEDAKNLYQMMDVPGVIKVYDVLTDYTNTTYAIIEYVEGDTIEEYVNKTGGSMTFPKAMHLLASVFQALNIFYIRNVYHASLKPSSIMITDADSKIVDFHDERYIQDEEMKLGGDFCLPLFNPPEANFILHDIHDKQFMAGVDVYFLAYIIYYLITGKQPEYSYHTKCIVKRPSELGVNITHSQEKALLQGLEREPKNRFQTVQEFYNALTGLQDSNSISLNIMGKLRKIFNDLRN